MKRNGFTIAELLGVIVILAILISIGVGVYTNIFEHEQEKTYENKVSMIEMAAVKWASETNLSRPTTITVQRLINENYYQADSYNEKTQEYVVEDPRDKTSMLCTTIDITLENNTPIAKVTETKDCSLVSNEEDSKNINITAYNYNTETKRVIEKLNITGENIDWTKNAVLLMVNPEGTFTKKDGSKIKYSKVIFSTGANQEEKIVNNNILSSISKGMEVREENYSNVYVVDASLFLNALYTVSLETEEGIKSKDVMVRIDKEAPEVEAEVQEEYTTEEKEIIIRGNDGAGSGLKGFYLSTSSVDKGTEFYETTYEAKVKKPTGTYYLYGEDKVGNINETGEKVEVGNIDSSTPTCEIRVIEGTLGKNGWYTSNVKIKMTSSNANKTGISYGLTTSNIPTYETGFLRENETINKEETLSENKVHHYYGYVKNSLGVTGKCELEIKVDKETPKVSVKAEPLTLGNQDYNFKDNIEAEFGPSGGSVVCDPPSSKKSGTYNVTCRVTANNGLETEKTFQVRHNYPATANWGTCIEKYNCHTGKWCVDSYACDPWSCIDWNQWPLTCHQYFGYTCCRRYVSGEVCDERKYSCITSYSCPQGGSPIGSTCYY